MDWFGHGRLQLDPLYCCIGIDGSTRVRCSSLCVSSGRFAKGKLRLMVHISLTLSTDGVSQQLWGALWTFLCFLFFAIAVLGGILAVSTPRYARQLA